MQENIPPRSLIGEYKGEVKARQHVGPLGTATTGSMYTFELNQESLLDSEQMGNEFRLIKQRSSPLFPLSY